MTYKKILIYATDFLLNLYWLFTEVFRKVKQKNSRFSAVLRVCLIPCLKLGYYRLFGQFISHAMNIFDTVFIVGRRIR